MTNNQSMWVFITGLLVTFGAVGGIEQSLDNTALLGSLFIACVGLAIMYVGTLGLRNAESY